MTKMRRVKICALCGNEFTERYGDSDSQWNAKAFCSITCANKSKNKSKSIFDRFNTYAVKNEHGCWGWSGTKDGHGYGTLSGRRHNGEFRRSPEKAHRVSYEMNFGEIPDGLVVRHKCDNPECTNPHHLELGTQSDNMKDCSIRGRINAKSLENLKRNSLTQEQEKEIRMIKFAGKNGRGGQTKKEVAERYGVCTCTIKNILKRG